MKQMKKLNLWMINVLLVAIYAFGLSVVTTSCGNEKDSANQEETDLYKYINAAEERESISDEERQEYAAFAWRNERSPESTMPKNFRTCMSDFKERDAHNGFDPNYIPSRKGLDSLKISASSEFSNNELDGLLDKLRTIHNGPVTIVDLRKESHGLLNGYHISEYGKNNWANIGLSREHIISEEEATIHGLVGSTITIYDLSSSNDYQPENPFTLNVTTAETEAEACAKRGVGYARFTTLDHCFPDPKSIDDFVAFVKALPANTWLHVHCAAGKGRTTLFLALYDFMRNPDVAEKDVIYRHYLQGGNFLYYQGDDPDEKEWKVELYKEKAVMIKLLYRYVQENHSKDYSVTWTKWKSQYQ